MSTKTSMMGLKVTYSFDSEQVFLSKSNSSLKVKFGEMELYNNETRLIGVVKLRACIQSVLKSSPEILSSLANKYDYNIYVCDYSEIDTPLVGYGLLSKLIINDYTDSSDDETSSGANGQNNNSQQKQKDILIPGKVEANMMNLLAYSNNKSKYTLSVKLNFKRIDRPKNKSMSSLIKFSKSSNSANSTTKNPIPNRKIIKPSKIKTSSKRITNPGPAPKATRTLSLPVRPSSLEFLPPNTNLTKDQLLSNQMLSFNYGNNLPSKRKHSYSVDQDEPIKASKRPSPLTQSFSTFHSLADQQYLDQSLLLNTINTTPQRNVNSGNNALSSQSYNASNKPKQQQQSTTKKGQNYWIIKEDLNANKENIPPEILSELSEVSMMSNPGNISTSAPTSDNTLPEDYTHNHGDTKGKHLIDTLQVNKELDELLNFNVDNFLANVHTHDLLGGHKKCASVGDVGLNNFHGENRDNKPNNANNRIINGSDKLTERQLPSLVINSLIAPVEETTSTPEDSDTPKDSDALTPIFETLSDKENEDHSSKKQKQGTKQGDNEEEDEEEDDDDDDDDDEPATSLFNDDDDEMERKSISNDRKVMTLVSSPFAVYD